MLSSTFSDCCRVTQTPGKGPLESVCRHYKTCSLDQSLKCLPLKRTREVMIRLLDWYHLTRNAKQLNWPKSVYLHKLVLVNVSSAIVIVAGFLPSTSPTDAQSINTGSGSGIILISMPWAILAVLAPCRCSCAHTTLPIGKGQGTVSFTFPDTNVNRRGSSSSSLALSPKSATLPGISCLFDSYSGTRVRYPPLQGISIAPFSTEVCATQGWIPRALITTNSVISAQFKKSLQNTGT